MDVKCHFELFLIFVSKVVKKPCVIETIMILLGCYHYSYFYNCGEPYG